MIDIQKTIRRAHAFGYDIQQSKRGWVLTRNEISYAFEKIGAVASFLNNQYLK